MTDIIPFKQPFDSTRLTEFKLRIDNEFNLFLSNKGDSCLLLNLLLDCQDEVGRLLQTPELTIDKKFELFQVYKRLKAVGDHIAESPFQARE